MTQGRKGHACTRCRRLLAGPFFLCLVAALAGCQSIGYYHQAIRGECQILIHRQPIQKLTADPGTSPELKEKFKLVLRLREFAQNELKLPIDGQYLHYVDLHRPYAVWNVHAAPAFSLEPKTWWYPFVGGLKYRGYFSETDAQRYARGLEKKGWEVYVEGVQAYSTLGWFKDPLLNTFISEPEPELAETLFHELAHQRFFISGDTDFNEAFATTVGEEGARRWLTRQNEPATIQKYAAALERQERFVQLIMAARETLKSVYKDKPAARLSGQNSASQSEASAELRSQREQVIAQLREGYAGIKVQWGGNSGYDSWFTNSLNNAQLNTVATYYDLVPGFRALLREKGEDLEGFYAEVKILGKLRKAERHQKVKAAAQRPRAESGAIAK